MSTFEYLLDVFDERHCDALSCFIFYQAVRWDSTAKSVLSSACVRTEPTATTSGDSAPVERASWDTTVNRVSTALLPHNNNTALKPKAHTAPPVGSYL